MDTIVSREELEKMFDQTLQEVTCRVGGIQLRQGDLPPEGEVYTVYVRFDRGVHSSLCLCAEKSMFIRLTKYMMRREEVTNQDMEDFAKEYFNVVCGHIAAKLFQATNVASRFSIPGFCSGRYQPEDHEEHLVLSYSGDQSEGAQLIHLQPVETPSGDWAGLCTDPADGLVLDGKEQPKKMGKRIMIVDDSRALAFQVSGLLEDTDYEVVACCQTGEDAIAEYEAIQPDLVTMDIIMPGMDGLETAHAILEEHPDAKIVMISSLAYDETLHEASSIGAKAFVCKPFDRDELIDTLERVLAEP